MLEVREISVRFGGHLALDHASLRAEAGRITGLIGPESAVFARDSRWFLRLALGFTGERGLPLEDGTASWSRVLASRPSARHAVR